MSEPRIVTFIDQFMKPKEWYDIQNLSLKDYRLIASKDDQKSAGYRLIDSPVSHKRKSSFGLNPIKPYRDYYGTFTLETRVLLTPVEVKYAIGYTLNSKVTTVDDYSNFGWLRMATGIDDIIYPNLSHQKQLLDYLINNSKYPKFMITRVYHHLQSDLHYQLTRLVAKRESVNSLYFGK